jgi:transposase
MALIRSREALVSCRTQLVNHVRGAVKSFGGRLPKGPAVSFHNKAVEHIPRALWPALGPTLETIASLTQRIRDYERQLETISKERYPEKPISCARSRGSGCLHRAHVRADPGRSLPLRKEPLCRGLPLGLVPARDQSGDRDPQKKRISKEGEEMLSVGFW